MADIIYSASEAAVLLGITHESLSNKCKRHGIKKVGGVYIIDATDLERLRSMKGGRPRKEGSK